MSPSSPPPSPLPLLLLLLLLTLPPTLSLKITTLTTFSLPPENLRRCCALLEAADYERALAEGGRGGGGGGADTMSPACYALHEFAAGSEVSGAGGGGEDGKGLVFKSPLPPSIEALLSRTVPSLRPCSSSSSSLSSNTTVFIDTFDPSSLASALSSHCSVRIVHYLSSTSPHYEQPVPVPFRGYGVSLAFKDLEYLTIDTDGVPADSVLEEVSPGGAVLDENGAGPSPLVPPSTASAKSLQSLPLLAVHAALTTDAAASSPPDVLAALAWTALNLPSRIPSLLSLSSSPSLSSTRRSLRATELLLLSLNLPQYLTSTISINNKPYPIATASGSTSSFNVHHLLKTITSHRSSALLPPSPYAPYALLLSLPLPPPPSLRLDVSSSSSALHFLNSVAKSSLYSSYSPSLSPYLSHSPGAQVPAVRLDLYTSLTPVDLSHPSVASEVLSTLLSGYPCRMAVLPFSSADLAQFSAIPDPKAFQEYLTEQASVPNSTFRRYLSFHYILTSLKDVPANMGATSSHLALQYLHGLALNSFPGSDDDAVLAATVGADHVPLVTFNITAAAKKYSKILALASSSSLPLSTSYLNGRPFSHSSYTSGLLSRISEDAEVVQEKVEMGKWTDRTKGSWYKKWMDIDTAVSVERFLGDGEWEEWNAEVMQEVYGSDENWIKREDDPAAPATVLISLTSCGDVTAAFSTAVLPPESAVRYLPSPPSLCGPPGKSNTVTANGYTFPPPSPSPLVPSLPSPWTAGDLSVVLEYAAALTVPYARFLEVETFETVAVGMVYVNAHHDGARDSSVVALKTIVKDGWLVYNDNVTDVEVTVTLEPLSMSSQKLLPVLLHLRDVVKVKLRVLPVTRSSEFLTYDGTNMPLASFYRFVTGGESGAVFEQKLFEGLDAGRIMTVNMDVPDSVEVVRTVATVDTDNLSVENLGTAEVVYGVANMLVHGQCYERAVERPPSGLQVVLTSFGGSVGGNYGGEGGGGCGGEAERGGGGGGEAEGGQCEAAVAVSGTVVMQNLGYFQLKSPTPGLHSVRILPSSRGAEIFEVVGGSVGGSVDVVLGDWAGGYELVWVERREGMEGEELIVEDGGRGEGGGAGSKGGEIGVEVLGGGEEEEEKAAAFMSSSEEEKEDGNGEEKGEEGGGGLLRRLKDFFWQPPAEPIKKQSPLPAAAAPAGPATATAKKETIHVYSVATGALYERFLKIMMLSVSQHTSLPVKFWLLDNFLSPSFKAAALALAEERGFEIAWVNYSWPSWLRGQAELQRRIWGMKILFLDVLFPLEVEKIIFVDADQVIRADLLELWELDMEDHVYGYVPFCDSNKETLGFQFWREGYWKQLLEGRPYHISALYVVDLLRFRARGTGDILRATYESLSRDSTSLSNLDQDLPNFISASRVPIFSLPQEWLWCESWCSMETKKEAKTIDLCNNPLHKEPKLDMAKRIVSGDLFDYSWEELDEQVKEIEKKAGVNVKEVSTPSFEV